MNKGVIGKVIDSDKTPKGELAPRIDTFISPIGVFHRKNVSMLKELYLGKIMYYLNEQVQKKAKDQKFADDHIIKYILDVYKLIANKELYEKVEKNIDNIGPKKFRKRIVDGNLKLYFTIPPFTDVSFEQIKEAAEFINIPLDEKVYLPELEVWTKEPVPVGVSYFQALEQTSEIYTNVRGAGRYQGLTRQATKGKALEGGQSIGNLDVYALLTYDAPATLTELITLRSDDHRSKREVINQIISTGSGTLPQSVGGGGSASLMKTFMLGMGLYTR